MPYRRRPPFLSNVARAAAVLALLAALIVVGAGLAAAAQAAGGPAGTVAAWAASWLVNVAGLLVAYRVLTGASLPWSAHVWGAVAAGTAWTVLLTARAPATWGGRSAGAGRVYGTFALVIKLPRVALPLGAGGAARRRD